MIGPLSLGKVAGSVFFYTMAKLRRKESDTHTLIRVFVAPVLSIQTHAVLARISRQETGSLSHCRQISPG